MELRNKLFMFLCVGFSLSAFSRVADNEVVLVDRGVRELDVDSSEAERLGRKYDIHYTLSGVSSNFGPSTGLSFGYFLDRNRLVLFEAANGRGQYNNYYWDYKDGNLFNPKLR